MSPKPENQICPLHAAELVTPAFIGSEVVEWEFTCPRVDHPVPGPLSWQGPSAIPAPATGAPVGVETAESLTAAVRGASVEHGGGWVEYGLVERAWALANPEDWATLLARYDHRFYWPQGATAQELPYTASKYLAGRLGALSRQGDVAFRIGIGTGYWDYLTKVSTWAPVDRAGSTTFMSFVESTAQITDYMPDTRPTG